VVSQVIIRDVVTQSQYGEVEELQKEVWGFDDRDVVPVTQLIAAKATGGVLLGAYEGPTMIGFVYGFVGYEDGSPVIHSHMLGVKPAHRGENIGFRLKMAQREQTLARGIRIITWTFDPLQSLNAHLNIEKLGVLAVAYKINFYGETSSSLHRNIGTDRLWARWELDSDRVRRCLSRPRESRTAFDDNSYLVRCDSHGMPLCCDLELREQRYLVVEIPGNIGALQQNSPDCASQWRASTREAFLKAFDAGFLVTRFRRSSGPVGVLGAYILTPARSNHSSTRSSD